MWTVNYVETVSAEILSGHIRVYDTYGRLTDGIYYLNGTATDAARRPFSQYLKTIYTYDKSGRLVKSTACDPEGSPCRKTIYKYDNSGRLSEEREYESNRSLFRKEVYSYDTQKKLTKVTTYFRKYKSRLVKNDVAFYDAQDNLIEWFLSRNENSVLRETYLYDVDRNLIEISHYVDKGVPKFKEVFTYNYDFQGNWIEQRKFAKGKEGGQILRTTIHRTITRSHATAPHLIEMRFNQTRNLTTHSTRRLDSVSFLVTFSGSLMEEPLLYSCESPSRSNLSNVPVGWT